MQLTIDGHAQSQQWGITHTVCTTYSCGYLVQRFTFRKTVCVLTDRATTDKIAVLLTLWSTMINWEHLKLSSVMIVTIIHDGNTSIHTSLVAMFIIFIVLETHTTEGIYSTINSSMLLVSVEVRRARVISHYCIYAPCPDFDLLFLCSFHLCFAVARLYYWGGLTPLPPENFLDSRSSEMGSSAIWVSWTPDSSYSAGQMNLLIYSSASSSCLSRSMHVANSK